jgi:(2Fe-2S) ferredoxin
MAVDDAHRRDDLLAAARERGATVAFLQQADPSLPAELTRLADSGAEQVVLVGVDLGPLGTGHSWLRRIAGHWWRERTGRRPQVAVATRLAHRLDEIDGAAAGTREVTGEEPGLTSAAWESVPAYRHQVMVCRGPRCTAKGATDGLRSLVLALMRHGLGDDDVLLVHTGCQFPCNQAPVISVQPDDVWYGRVDPEAAEAIVGRHLVDGVPLDSHRLPRRR